MTIKCTVKLKKGVEAYSDISLNFLFFVKIFMEVYTMLMFLAGCAVGVVVGSALTIIYIYNREKRR